VQKADAPPAVAVLAGNDDLPAPSPGDCGLRVHAAIPEVDLISPRQFLPVPLGLIRRVARPGERPRLAACPDLLRRHGIMAVSVFEDKRGLVAMLGNFGPNPYTLLRGDYLGQLYFTAAIIPAAV
jgi:dUTPase